VGAASDDRIMSIDAAGMKYWSGRGGVVLVDDPVDTVRRVADAYGTRWLVLGGDPQVPLAEQIQVSGTRPEWVGPPAFRAGDMAIYPICTDAWDHRCEATPATPAYQRGGTG